MKSKIFLLILMSVAMLTGGCQLANKALNKAGYQAIDEANAKIAQVQAAADAKQQQIASQINTENQKVYNAQVGQLQGASDELFFASYAYSLNPSPNRNAVVVNYHVKAATDYVRLPPSQTAVTKALTEVKAELDETKTTVADLEAKYNQEKAKADKLAADKAAAETEKARLEGEKLKVEQDRNAKVTALNHEKDVNTRHVLDQQQQAVDDANAIKEFKNRLMMWTGGAALIALIAAIYSPVFKRESGILAGILGAVTVAIPFIEPVHVGLGLGVVGAGLIAWMIVKHNKESKTAQTIIEKEQKISSNLVNVIQDVKEKAKDVFDAHLKPALTDWNTVVTKHPDGTITKLPDTEVMHAIDEKLIESDRK